MKYASWLIAIILCTAFSRDGFSQVKERLTKEEVEKQLPPLTEIVQHIEMTDGQRKQYQQQLLRFRRA